MVCTSIQANGLGATVTVKLVCDSLDEKTTGKRSAGNPHAAFDEGDLWKLRPLLYRITFFMLVFEMLSRDSVASVSYVD
jgi:hypothetical protein